MKAQNFGLKQNRKTRQGKKQTNWMNKQRQKKWTHTEKVKYRLTEKTNAKKIATESKQIESKTR
jgi:hypothetical protein